MSRTTKWKLEKAKVKVVFRLRFHATNIPPSGWEKLYICFIPAESGKIIAKTSKANVRNGTCKWPDPIYETTRLLIDSRNKRYDDKLYNLIVGMGSSHASILGEAIINLADYADASNPFVVSLPLHGSDQGTILHVTVQLLTAKTGFREFEQQFDRGLHNSSYLNREEEGSTATSSFSELHISDDHEIKVNTKTHFGSEYKELITAADQMGIHEYSDSPIEYNGSCDDSKSHYESQDGSAHTQDQPTEKADCSMDNDLAIAREENHRLRGSLKMAESFIFELKQELNTLHSHANQMSLETRKISQHLTDEISSGLKLERDIKILKSECSKLKDELEQLKEVKLRSSFIERSRDLEETRCSRGFNMGEGQSLELLSQLDEAKAERGNLCKQMNEMECYYEALVQELEENRDRILAEFQRLRYEHSACVYTISTCKTETESIRHCMKDQILKFDKERYALSCVNEEIEKRAMVAEARVQELEENQERVLDGFQTINNEHSTCADTISRCKAEIESLRRDMNRQAVNFAKEKHDLGCAYEKRILAAEALVQELEKKRELILGEFQSLKDEHFTCGDIISTCKAQTEKIRGDMNVQTLKFAKERHDLCCVNEELNKRVMAAEALVQELEKKRELILGEFQILKDEHLSCGDIISTCKAQTDTIRGDMNVQTLKFAKERHDLCSVNEELEKRVIAAEALVQELEKKRELILGEFQILKDEHLSCGDIILTCKAQTETIRGDMNVQTLKFAKERHDLCCVNEELKKRIMATEVLVQELEKKRELILGEFQSFKNEHLTCADTVLTFKTQTETIRQNMNDQILKFGKERHDLGCMEKLEKKVSELEENLKQILEEFESIKNEHSTGADAISTCKTDAESIRQDMKYLILKFAKEKHGLSCVNEELEKRVLELNENRQQILGEFQSLKDEHLTCDDTILTFKTETESIRHNMNDRIFKLTEEKHALDCVNKELEKRVATLESALERARLNYSTAVTHLQKDLDMLSSQVSSMFETNQNLIKQTFSESSVTLSEKCSNMINNPCEKKLSSDDDISEEQIYEIFCANLYLDVYSLTLQEKLFEVSIDADKMKEQIKEYAQKLEASHDKKKPEGQSESLRIAFMKEQCETTVQELKHQLFVSKRHGDDVLIKLQDALDEIECRKKSEASYLKKMKEMSLKIMGLESELQSIQAELDCALLNLECCKEEKEKIVASMLKSEEEKLNIMFELSLFQEQLSQKNLMMSSGSCFQGLQRDLMQLDKANEELGSIYPKFKDFPGDGNALERVLALEIELAGALAAKKKSSIQFQSSFLKQHSDEEAVFKSFRDINELIKDTLDMRSRYVNVETELNEMHERYSQLSLQFAEVEGERQKLMMTIKNVRSPRNRSSYETVNTNLL